MQEQSAAGGKQIRVRLREWVDRIEHVLPGQPPIRDFVHHNTLHGFQHLPFPQALAEAQTATGVLAYLPEDRFRSLLAEGRITAEDLKCALRDVAGIDPSEVLLTVPRGPIRRMDAQLAVLAHSIRPVTTAQLRWLARERRALASFQADVSGDARQKLVEEASRHGIVPEVAAIADLWKALLDTLAIEADVDQAEVAADIEADPFVERDGVDDARGRETQASYLWSSLTDRLGRDYTLRGLLSALTGEDILETLRPGLIRHLGAHLDQGLAAWHNPDRASGFYAAWRGSVRNDLGWELDELSEFRRDIGDLPESPLDAVIHALTELGFSESHWARYLERLALELPGWSAMFLWRSRHPGYAGSHDVPVDMMDYLAVRLNAERLVAQDLVHRQWGITLRLADLEEHFRRHPAELCVRHAYFRADLPEHLSDLIEQHLARTHETRGRTDDAVWRSLARRVEAWTGAPNGVGIAARVAWPLFKLCQHLGLCGEDVRSFGAPGLEALLACLGRLDEGATGFVWLNAYERNYREPLFAALAANHGRCAKRASAPAAQIVFCMDDREEGMRRLLEEIDPTIETLGGAAHFGVFQNWRGLDDANLTPLCPVVPVVVKPAHVVREVPRPGTEALASRHFARRALRLRGKELLYAGTRRLLLGGPAIVAVAALWTPVVLAAKSLVPAFAGRIANRWRVAFDRHVPTRLAMSAAADSPPATPEAPRAGFTDVEQADRVLAFLRALGLTSNFAPLVVIMGHGSNSENNPHLAAYDCGACAGRHSGPNARLFAAMANRPGVRTLLSERGMRIPDTTWFVGAEHNTCDDDVTWYDVEDLPAASRPTYGKLERDLAQASSEHARERCRRFASAQDGLAPAHARRHVLDRRHDFSQVRPELGHATNACAIIGRRLLTRGAFLDRRAFLISYDPTLDAEGSVLERLLLANGPVGAGINLEYYFSTVSNERLGCGTKVVHNVAGLFGVMEGTASDLRTGLPRQMIEVHEAMRLLVVVEHRTDVLSAIYSRQPALQELIGNGWILLAAKDPDSPAIDFFDPHKGWQRWAGSADVPTVVRSADWFLGEREPLPPALLTRPLEAA